MQETDAQAAEVAGNGSIKLKKDFMGEQFQVCQLDEIKITQLDFLL